MKRTSPPKAASNVEVAIREQQACDTKRAPLDVTCVASGKDVRIYHFQTDPFCWYVIEESGRLAVVDAGFPGHYRVFRRGIAQLGFGVEDVEGIVLTHAHSDHTGFAARLCGDAKAPIFVHSHDATMAQRVLQLPWVTLLGNAWRPWGSGMLLHAARNGLFTCPRIRHVHTLADGHEVDMPGRPIVIHTPGHTPGHIALHVNSASALLAGDSVLTQSLLTGKSQPPLVPERPFNMNDQEAHRSVARYRGLGEITILPGHGRAWTGDFAELDPSSARQT